MPVAPGRRTTLSLARRPPACRLRSTCLILSGSTWRCWT